MVGNDARAGSAAGTGVCDGPAEVEAVTGSDSLVLAAQSGDREALERLCVAYRPLIGRIASRYHTFPSGVDREDLEQEAARALCELTLQYDPGKGVPLAGYLKAKLGWRISHYLRQEKRRTGHMALDSVAVDSIPGAVVESPAPGIASPQLLRAIRRLSPRQRAVIAGLFWRERSERELARELRVSHQAVSALRKRAEASLRRQLKRDEV